MRVVGIREFEHVVSDRNERFHRDVALHEIAEQLASEFRLSVCKATVWHFFDKRGITFKKRQRMRANSSATM